VVHLFLRLAAAAAAAAVVVVTICVFVPLILPQTPLQQH
jgi:hypothetical protein